MKCKYKTGEMSGIDCPCEECQKIRDFIHQKEINGEIFLTGDKKELKKIRR